MAMSHPQAAVQFELVARLTDWSQQYGLSSKHITTTSSSTSPNPHLCVSIPPHPAPNMSPRAVARVEAALGCANRAQRNTAQCSATRRGWRRLAPGHLLTLQRTHAGRHARMLWPKHACMELKGRVGRRARAEGLGRVAADAARRACMYSLTLGRRGEGGFIGGVEVREPDCWVWVARICVHAVDGGPPGAGTYLPTYFLACEPR
ncbi:hypothetical protein IWX50DRAFT_697373 [Phyllosticta citricarpa]